MFDGAEPEFDGEFQLGEHLVTASTKLLVLDKLLAKFKRDGEKVLVRLNFRDKRAFHPLRVLTLRLLCRNPQDFLANDSNVGYYSRYDFQCIRSFDARTIVAHVVSRLGV